MPRVVIEYSDAPSCGDATRALMQAAFDICAKAGVVQAEDIMVRAVPRRHPVLRGGARSLVHITLPMRAGRSAEQKEVLAIAPRARPGAGFPHIDAPSIDMRDMDPTACKKPRAAQASDPAARPGADDRRAGHPVGRAQSPYCSRA